MGYQQDITVKFSRRLRKLRKKYNLTQEELAEKADISYKNVQYLESKNPTCPSLRTLHKIATAFNIPLSKLLDFK
ncbi:MAG: helix-turn-helix domain-containing protein [Candidatus Omnitrophica bacterium]|nr:helix-turn-helix domain-containing protein [Candidatus Omnitrophota bacterium]